MHYLFLQYIYTCFVIVGENSSVDDTLVTPVVLLEVESFSFSIHSIIQILILSVSWAFFFFYPKYLKFEFKGLISFEQIVFGKIFFFKLFFKTTNINFCKSENIFLKIFIIAAAWKYKLQTFRNPNVQAPIVLHLTIYDVLAFL